MIVTFGSLWLVFEKTTGTYEELEVWKKTMDLVVDIYDRTGTFPKSEMYGLTSQMQRAAVSVPNNIAEGKGRYSQRELVQFLFRARGSLMELRTQISIAQRLTFLDRSSAERLSTRVSEVGRLLNGLINHFQTAQVRS